MPHAFITGAAKRVGKSMALALAEHGYDITIHYHHSAAEAEQTRQDVMAFGRHCTLLQANLAQGDSLSNLIKNAAQALGTIDVIVHNASLFEKDTFTSLTPDGLTGHLQVNLIAPVLLTSAYQQHLPEGKEGHVICLGDGMTGWSISSEFLSYSLSKLALEQFVTLAASALAPRIRVNGIAPGATLQGHMDKKDTFDKVRNLTPLKRNSDPQEVVSALMMLLHTPSITGQIIRLNSGMHLPSNHMLKMEL